jgi:hypothetical protein
MNNRNEMLKNIQDKQEQARALGVDLARRYAVEDLLRSEGIEVPDGAIGLAPIGTQQAITRIRINGGESIKLSEPIGLNEWKERFGLLRGRGA